MWRKERRYREDRKSWLAVDIGCPNLDRAAENRQRIKEGYATAFWKLMEQTIRKTGKYKRLPDWIPTEERLFIKEEERGNG